MPQTYYDVHRPPTGNYKGKPTEIERMLRQPGSFYNRGVKYGHRDPQYGDFLGALTAAHSRMMAVLKEGGYTDKQGITVRPAQASRLYVPLVSTAALNAMQVRTNMPMVECIREVDKALPESADDVRAGRIRGLEVVQRELSDTDGQTTGWVTRMNLRIESPALYNEYMAGNAAARGPEDPLDTPNAANIGTTTMQLAECRGELLPPGFVADLTSEVSQTLRSHVSIPFANIYPYRLYGVAR